ncbi:unnamed protein product [Litomosoides sigmodontis]|uniref:Uncharacterized protein n=1 Tax=Litomosoides sigmodontis TaxID=42156 RepID=A0A3P7KEU8_LITSI|nr:unnamed protein product [Litomosoides sigmodontis]
MDMSKVGRRDSLIRQASVQRLQNIAMKQQKVEKHRQEVAESSEYSRILKELNDEGIELLWPPSSASTPMRITVVLAAEDHFQYQSMGE